MGHTSYITGPPELNIAVTQLRDAVEQHRRVMIDTLAGRYYGKVVEYDTYMPHKDRAAYTQIFRLQTEDGQQTTIVLNDVLAYRIDLS